MWKTTEPRNLWTAVQDFDSLNCDGKVRGLIEPAVQTGMNALNFEPEDYQAALVGYFQSKSRSSRHGFG